MKWASSPNLRGLVHIQILFALSIKQRLLYCRNEVYFNDAGVHKKTRQREKRWSLSCAQQQLVHKIKLLYRACKVTSAFQFL